MLSVIMPSVVILSVAEPNQHPTEDVNLMLHFLGRLLALHTYIKRQKGLLLTSTLSYTPKGYITKRAISLIRAARVFAIDIDIYPRN